MESLRGRHADVQNTRKRPPETRGVVMKVSKKPLDKKLYSLIERSVHRETYHIFHSTLYEHD
ncbi:MAG: hypothetical protein HY518_01915 [Candidatus Aenigmarchaeota archaeon]|nr:hypothetical protein [Candidatus Aenigmarchaeota archaeon]